jgi:peroxiredoxin Q/BCP
MLDIGTNAPDFSCKTDGEGELTLASLKGKNIVLYFYPKDMTPGCTTQAQNFRDQQSAFNDLNTVIVGVSKDSVKRHDKFKEKHDLNFTLLSDEDGTICESYGVWVEKNMYGRKYMGIERSTFLIDPDGVIQHIWRKVKVKTHIEDVLNQLQS